MTPLSLGSRAARVLLTLILLPLSLPQILNNDVKPSLFVDAIPTFLDIFGANARLEAKRAAKREAERRAKYFVLSLGRSIEVSVRKRYVYYGFVVVVAALLQFGPLLIAYLYSDKRRNGKRRRGNRPGACLDVVVVGCGLPKKGVGWFHMVQLLDMTNVNVRALVEPFYFDKRPKIFNALVQSLERKGVVCVASVGELDKFQRKTLCIIAVPTNQTPLVFRQCVELGATAIYLEKVGAPSVRHLIDMRTLATSKNISVYIGYCINVARYVQDAVALSQQVKNSHVFFCHNENNSEANIADVFARNTEGLMKSMAIHELAVLVTFFGVRVDNIDRFRVHTSEKFTKRITVRRKPNTSTVYLTDFSRAAFKIMTKDNVSVSLMVDRCGGNSSFAVVKDACGREVQKFEHPRALAAKKLEKQIQSDPEMRPDFFIQSDNYLQLKREVIDAMLNQTDAKHAATIDVGIETMRLAEFATDQLTKALDGNTPSGKNLVGSP